MNIILRTVPWQNGTVIAKLHKLVNDITELPDYILRTL